MFSSCLIHFCLCGETLLSRCTRGLSDIVLYAIILVLGLASLRRDRILFMASFLDFQLRFICYGCVRVHAGDELLATFGQKKQAIDR